MTELDVEYVVFVALSTAIGMVLTKRREINKKVLRLDNILNHSISNRLFRSGKPTDFLYSFIKGLHSSRAENSKHACGSESRPVLAGKRIIQPRLFNSLMIFLNLPRNCLSYPEVKCLLGMCRLRLKQPRRNNLCRIKPLI